LTVASTEDDLYKEDEMSILYTIMDQASTAVSKLEMILNQEKGKLNSMVESMADGVFMVDTRNRLLVINPAARNMLGIAKPQPSIFDVLDALSSKIDLRTKIEESLKSDKLIVQDKLELQGKFARADQSGQRCGQSGSRSCGFVPRHHAGRSHRKNARRFYVDDGPRVAQSADRHPIHRQSFERRKNQK
jgi:PAS domain-containing protein